MENENNLYKTTDFYLAVWLVVNGIDIRVEATDKNRVTFVCDDFQDREILIGGFYRAELLQKYIVEIKSLKNKMYAKKPPVVYSQQGKSNEKTRKKT